MKSRKGFVSFLSVVFLSVANSRLVLVSGIVSISALIASWTLWPLLNGTELYYLLYMVDFLNYAAFLLFFVCISRVSASADLPFPEQRGWVSILITVVLLSLGNIVLQEIKDGLTGIMERYWTTIAFGFLEFLCFYYLVIFSVTKTGLFSSLLGPSIVFLQKIHWFLLYYLLFLVTGAATSFAPLLWKGIEPAAFRLYIDIVGVVLRYLGSFVLVALILTLNKKRNSKHEADSVTAAVEPEVEIEH